LLEFLLIRDIEEVGDVLVVSESVPLAGFELKEEIAGEEGFEEFDGLAAVAFDADVLGESAMKAVSLAGLDQLFLAARAGVGDVPPEFAHTGGLEFESAATRART
jgi:hypothetical protein